MPQLINRRVILLAAGCAAATVVADPIAAQPKALRGEVTFAGGVPIPKGTVQVYLDDPAHQDNTLRDTTKTGIGSDGKSRILDFSLALPEQMSASPTRQVVALLEREDGWLLARGSAKFEADASVSITLNKAMY